MKAKIISASRRTDIPAFYSPWFINRVRAGFCVYPNPLYPSKRYRVSLRPEDVLGIVFWTRHPAPLMPYLEELDRQGFTYYFQYTVTGYPRSVEFRSPALGTALKTFVELSRRIGPERVIWRYDPIILNPKLTLPWHGDNFKRIADTLAAYTGTVVVSVVDPYARTQRRLGSADNGVSYDPGAYAEVLAMVVAEAQERHLLVQSCAEGDLPMAGISQGSCVDATRLLRLGGPPPLTKAKPHKQRKECHCHESVDIGINDSCGFGCLYCYATVSHEKALSTVRSHRPEWTGIAEDFQVESPADPLVKQSELWPKDKP